MSEAKIYEPRDTRPERWGKLGAMLGAAAVWYYFVFPHLEVAYDEAVGARVAFDKGEADPNLAHTSLEALRNTSNAKDQVVALHVGGVLAALGLAALIRPRKPRDQYWHEGW